MSIFAKKLFSRRASEVNASQKERVTVRAYRCFPLVGARHLIVHAPQQTKDVLFHASLGELRNIRLSIESKDDGALLRITSAGNGVIAGFLFKDAGQARETANAIAQAIRPRRARYVLGAVVLASAAMWVLPAQQTSTPAYTAAPAAMPQLPAAPQIVRPQVAAGDQAVGTAAGAATTDINDPFGLKVVPQK